MPSLTKITANFFVGLINRLGVRPPPEEAFLLSNIVQPVSIVDADISIPAISTSQLLDTPFTAGVLVAPAINTVLADTGPQVAGNYSIEVMLNFQDGAAVQQVALQRRDSTNAVNIWQQVFFGTGNAAGNAGVLVLQNFRVVLQANERIRIINLVAGGAGSLFDANIWLLPS